MSESVIVAEPSRLVFDGKRMRKAVTRRVIDYQSTIVNYLSVCLFFNQSTSHCIYNPMLTLQSK